MPVGTLSYQLPDDEDEFRLAANARRLLIAIKYHENPSADAVRLADNVRQILAEEAGDLLC